MNHYYVVQLKDETNEKIYSPAIISIIPGDAVSSGSVFMGPL